MTTSLTSSKRIQPPARSVATTLSPPRPLQVVQNAAALAASRGQFVPRALSPQAKVQTAAAAANGGSALGRIAQEYGGSSPSSLTPPRPPVATAAPQPPQQQAAHKRSYEEILDSDEEVRSYCHWQHTAYSTRI